MPSVLFDPTARRPVVLLVVVLIRAWPPVAVTTNKPVPRQMLSPDPPNSLPIDNDPMGLTLPRPIQFDKLLYFLLTRRPLQSCYIVMNNDISIQPLTMYHFEKLDDESLGPYVQRQRTLTKIDVH